MTQECPNRLTPRAARTAGSIRGASICRPVPHSATIATTVVVTVTVSAAATVTTITMMTTRTGTSSTSASNNGNDNTNTNAIITGSADANQRLTCL